MLSHQGLDCKLAYSVKHNMNMVRNFTISHGINLIRTQSWFRLTYPMSNIHFYSIILYFIIMSFCRNLAMTAPRCGIGRGLWWGLCSITNNPTLGPLLTCDQCKAVRNNTGAAVSGMSSLPTLPSTCMYDDTTLGIHLRPTTDLDQSFLSFMKVCRQTHPSVFAKAAY